MFGAFVRFGGGMLAVLHAFGILWCLRVAPQLLWPHDAAGDDLTPKKRESDVHAPKKRGELSTSDCRLQKRLTDFPFLR